MLSKIKHITDFLFSFIPASSLHPGCLALLILLTLSCLGATPACADARTVKVGVYEDPPKVFTSHSGKPSGIFIDIIEQIAKSEGWTLRYVPGTWAQGLDRAARGEIDLMPDVAYMPEREMIYYFHKIPVLSTWSQVYARKGSGIQSLLDLNGKRIAALENSIQLVTFTRLAKSFELNITLVPVADYKTEFEMVAAGKADAGLTNRLYGLMNARKAGLVDTPIMFDPAPFFFVAPKTASGQRLLDTIDRHLSELKKDPESAYYQAMRRWTSEEVQFSLPRWLETVGIVTALLLLMSLGGSLVLKHQVNARTRELKQANTDLRASEQRYRHLFEQNPAPMLIYQRETLAMLAVNDAFVHHYGYSREEALALLLTDLYPENEKEPVKKVIARLKGHNYVGEWHHRKADGALITIVVRSHDIDYWGHAARIAVISDVTEMKLMEAELRNVNETLDQKVRERTAELVQKNLELEAANRAKSLFLANMSHEIRTPLNAVLGFSQIVLHDPNLSPESRHNLQTVTRSGEHLLTLINDVLDMAKIESGRMVLEQAPFDLPGLLADVTDMFAPRAAGKNLQLIRELHPGMPRHIAGDAGKLRQIIINLLGNAVKFTQKGGICLRARTCSREDGTWLEVEVQDSGPGIAPGDLERVFNAFEQSEIGKRSQSGTGLGLTISRECARSMGGSLTVTSQPGQGACFHLALPVTEAAQAPEAPSQGNQRRIVRLKPGQHPWRILVVDDRDTNREILVKMLAPLGFTLIEAEDGQAALEAFAAQAPHLVLMDVVMPVLDGREAIRRIRALPEGREVPIIAVSASVFEDQLREIIQVGANDYLRKPLREEELFEKVARFLPAEFEYEGEEVSLPLPQGEALSATGVAEAMALLPEAVRAELLAAARQLDKGGVMAVLNRLDGMPPAVADRVRSLAESYRFDLLEDELLQAAVRRGEDGS
jgi:PAS domain S-box-containing protein